MIVPLIVKSDLDFCSIATVGSKISNSAHASYWLCNVAENSSSIEIQQKQIVEAFHEIANLLGYRVEEIEPAAVDAEALTQTQEVRHVDR